MGFAGKLTSAILGLLLLVGATVGIIGYDVAYRQVDEAVGIELVGCANITTGLVDPADIEALKNGDTTKLASLEERLNWTADHKAIFKEAFILSLDGKLLAADKRLKAQGYKAGDTYYFADEDKKMIVDMKHSLYSKVYEFNGENLKTGYGPIYKDHDPNKEIIALMAINFDASIIKDRTKETLFAPFLVGAIVLAIAAVVVFFVIRRMVRPVVQVSAQLNRIAMGELTVAPLGLKGKDEVGMLARGVDQMTENLRKLITEVGQMSVQVAASSQQLTASADQTGKASEQIALVTQDLASGSEKQLHSLQETTEVIQGMSEAMGRIAGNAEQVTAAATNTAETAQQGRTVVRTAIGQMDSVDKMIKELSAIIGGLDHRSKEISEIISVMTDIAKQTNLLALNAAIEAARAGEQGRGFAVVADSVRKLAEQSSGSANQITELISDIVGQMGQAASAMEAATKEVAQGTELVHSTGRSFEQIQESASETAKQVEDVSSAVRHLSDGSEKIVQSVQLLLDVADQATEGTHSVSAASEEQLATMEEIAASAAYLSNLSEELQVLIDRFKV